MFPNINFDIVCRRFLQKLLQFSNFEEDIGLYDVLLFVAAFKLLLKQTWFEQTYSSTGVFLKIIQTLK